MIGEVFKRWLYWGEDQISHGIVPRLLRAYLLWNNEWYGSHAIRYRPIVRFLTDLRNSVSFPILEVGSGDRGIAPFINRRVVTVDLRFDPENLKRVRKMNIPVRGRIENLPFSDGSFDTAIAVDLFEHLTAFQREIAIREMFRVVKKNVVVAVPCGKKAADMEGILDRFHRKRFGVSNKWLVEHKKTGLPEADKLLETFKNQRHFTKIKIESNTPLWLWFALEALEIVIPRNYFRQIMTGWLVNVASRWKPLNAYRQIFYIQLSENK
ncbi:MAG: class I SAM-dependent methyltransferase [Armatimonadetes bacterium]|nr:class I SAM-dependent methyltransferase [Armatimonadota bacterium]